VSFSLLEQEPLAELSSEGGIKPVSASHLLQQVVIDYIGSVESSTQLLGHSVRSR